MKNSIIANCKTSSFTITYRTILLIIKVLKENCGYIYNCIFVPFKDMFDKSVENVKLSYLVWDGVQPATVGHGFMIRRWFNIVDK